MLAAAAVVLGTAIALAGATGASAGVFTAHVISGHGVTFLNVRQTASTSGAVLRTLSPGSAVGLNCYQVGTAVAGPYGTSSIWYSIDGGGFVSDAYLETGSNGAVTGTCTASKTAPAPTVTRESKAYAWATGEIGHLSDDWGRATQGWCSRWSVGAYGRQNSGYNTAWDMYNAFKSMGLTHTGSAPAGTFVFFAPNSLNGQAGHVAISDGNGGMITSVGSIGGHLPIADKALSFAGAPYVGWSYAPNGWTR